MTTARRSRPIRRRPRLATTAITKRFDISHDLWKVWLQKPEGYAFKAGQYCTIGVNGIERAYSIVSAPYEDDLELFVELVPPPEGNLTPLLHELREGSEVTIRPRPKGIFVFDASLPNQLFVATVTGVVPYLSIIRQYLHDGRTGHRFYILMGASYADEFGYDDELQALADDHPDMIRFVPTVSRPDEPQNADMERRNGPRQQPSGEIRRPLEPPPGRHHHLRLRPPRHDRRRERAHDAPRLRGEGRALLEGRLGRRALGIRLKRTTIAPFAAAFCAAADSARHS